MNVNTMGCEVLLTKSAAYRPVPLPCVAHKSWEILSHLLCTMNGHWRSHWDVICSDTMMVADHCDFGQISDHIWQFLSSMEV
jgi:hypothetical protein